MVLNLCWTIFLLILNLFLFSNYVFDWVAIQAVPLGNPKAAAHVAVRPSVLVTVKH